MNSRYTADTVFPTVVYVESALGALHRVDAGSIAGVSEAHSDSVSSIEMSRIHPSVSLCIKIWLYAHQYTKASAPSYFHRRILYVDSG